MSQVSETELRADRRPDLHQRDPQSSESGLIETQATSAWPTSAHGLRQETLQIVNDNDWFITASEPVIVTGLAAAVSPLLFVLLALGVPLVIYALVSYVRLMRRSRSQRSATPRTSVTNSTRGLDDMSRALDEAAAGNLAVELPVDFEDERLAALAQSFDNTLDRLRALVAQAQGHGVQLAQAAGQLRATAQEQAGSATEQSAVVTQTTATIEELAATAAQISETAGRLRGWRKTRCH